MSGPDRTSLPTEVLRRKAAIFEDLTGVLHDRMRVRRQRQASGAAALFVACGAVLALILSPSTSDAPSDAARPPSVDIATHADPTADGRFAWITTLDESPALERLDDDRLDAELRAAGFSGGFARTEEGVVVASR
jgi:hypothetical protein